MSNTKEVSNVRELNEVHADSPRLHELLLNMFNKHAQLDEKHEQLKGELKEAELARDSYKKKAKGQSKDSFVVVLVDGDGCVFEDGFVKNGAEGGRRAADLIQQIVMRKLSERDHNDSKIVVRVYGNVVGLSKALHQAGLCGSQERDLAAFTAGFTGSQALFDFVDSGTLERGTRIKIEAAVRHYASLPQCRHIYFAGCHDTAYIKNLAPYATHKHRITLIETPNMREEFKNLGFEVARFPGVFRDKSLDKSNNRRLKRVTSLSGLQSGKPKDNVDGPSMKKVDAKPCAFFLKAGGCKFGDKCNFSHIAGPKFSRIKRLPVTNDRRSMVQDWRKKQEVEKSTPSRRRRSHHSDVESIRDGKAVSIGFEQKKIDFGAILIHDHRAKTGYVPVNSDDYRLDTYLTPPTKRTHDEFHVRHEPKHLCNHFHILGHCEHGSDCDYDHAPISRKLRDVLRMKARSSPCRKRGACRIPDCINGHICQLQDCEYRGGETKCKMSLAYHLKGQELQAVKYAICEVEENRPPRNCASTISITDQGSVSPESAGIDTPDDEPKQDFTEMLIDFDDKPLDGDELSDNGSVESFLSLPMARSQASMAKSI